MWEFHGNDVIINPLVHEYTLVWLTGWSRSPKQDKLVFETLGFFSNVRIRIISGPKRPLPSMPKIKLNAWYQIPKYSYIEVLPDLEESSRLVMDIVEEELKLCNKVFLGGFSAGGVTSFYTMIKSDLPILGLISLSAFTYFFKVPQHRHNSNFLFYIGQKDELIKLKNQRDWIQTESKKLNTKYVEEEGLGHMYSYKEFRTIHNWMNTAAGLPKL